MSQHTPILIKVDEPDSPRLWIIQRCLECDVEITRHEIHVPDVPAGASEDVLNKVADELVHNFGHDDAHAFLEHIAKAEGAP